tara:strand:- start:12 stop:365 length:354 start_codon:yes stop_codon:yes gene_type:complete
MLGVGVSILNTFDHSLGQPHWADQNVVIWHSVLPVDRYLLLVLIFCLLKLLGHNKVNPFPKVTRLSNSVCRHVVLDLISERLIVEPVVYTVVGPVGTINVNLQEHAGKEQDSEGEES